MSGSFKARNSLQGHKGNYRKKVGATLVCCLNKASALLNDSANDIFYTNCICQKIHDICWQIKDAYRGEVPVLATNGQSPEELIEAVRGRVERDGTISGAEREKIIEGLNAVLAMID